VRILSIGEVLWDVFGEREFLGGAPLNFSVSAQRLRNAVALLSGIGMDERGTRACGAMQKMGLDTSLMQKTTASTGAAIVTTDSSGNASFVIDRPAAFDMVELTDSVLAAITASRPDWIYFGTLAQIMREGEERLTRAFLLLL
jgi:fructokinase